jgi:hypothetical protein
MEKIPLGFMVAITLALVVARLLTNVFQVSQVLIVIVFMGGLTGYFEYVMRRDRQG